MSLRSLLAGWSVPAPTRDRRIRKYSTTGDILAFKRCRRQYGYFNVRGFSSATATQRYFGTLVHDVLDRVHRAYHQAISTAGGVPTAVSLPDEAGVRELVAEAHDRLIRSGVRPYNAKAQQEHAAKLIWRFLVLIGPHFFPHVTETEYRLERALRTDVGRDYVLDGVVDVLSGAVSHALGLPFPTTPGDFEIWDYKSGRQPCPRSAEASAYAYQLRVYAELFRQQTGRYPARCALLFLGELGEDHRWHEPGPTLADFPGLITTLEPDPEAIAAAMQDFHATVEAIEAERCKPYALQWQAPEHAVDSATCEACELRYNCHRFRDGARQREEAL